jgi:hypothetical protein
MNYPAASGRGIGIKIELIAHLAVSYITERYLYSNPESFVRKY